MKKTFITALLGLSFAASASAATAGTWDSEALAGITNGVLTIPAGTITDTAQGDFSVTAVLDAAAVKTALTGSQWGAFLQVQDVTDSYSFNLALNGSSSNNNDGIWTGLGTATNQSISTEISNGLGAAYAAGTDYQGMAITMTIGGSGTNFYLTLVGTDGTATEYTGNARGSWHYGTFDLEQITFTDKVTYISLDEDVLNATGAFAANTAALTATGVTIVVPEPATATLSLLALAGLAARRRRK